MKKTIMFCLLLAVVGGCILSVQPLYTKEDIIYDPNLIGCWTEENNNKWIFEKAEPNTYSLNLILDNENGLFKVHLLKIDKYRFLDLFPEDPNITGNDFYKMHILGVHSFLKVEQIEPILKIRMVADKFEDKLKSDPNLIKHMKTEQGTTLITATTEELQEFMKKYAEESWLFGEVTELKRCQTIKPKASEPNDPNKK